MCTVSWLPAPGGYTLCFNRDERHTRGPALPPEHRVAAGRAFLAPYDSDHGGTWLAVNDAGLTLALLNRYGPRRGTAMGPARSRGLVILELIGAGGVTAALQALERADLRHTAPFVLVALEPDRPPRLAEWDGAILAMARIRCLISSSIYIYLIGRSDPTAALCRSPHRTTERSMSPHMSVTADFVSTYIFCPR